MKGSSKLLINEPALQVLPSLACLVGLNEAIVLQQIHYWLYTAEKTKKLGVWKNNHWWIFNKLEEWRESNFPFWSTKTIQRALDSLREKRIVLTARLSGNNLDQTLYYTIDYDRIDLLFEAGAVGQLEQKETNSPFGQDDQMERPFGQDDQIHLDNLTKCIWTSCPTVNIESETSYSEITQRDKPAAPELWKMIVEQLYYEMGPNNRNFTEYVKPLVPICVEDGTLQITGPDFYGRAWCESRLGKRIERLASGIIGEEITVEFLEPVTVLAEVTT